MSGIHRLWILPIITSLFCCIGIIVPYAIGATNGNIPAILPFISDGGAFSPEKSIFSLFQNISAVLLMITAYIKHLHRSDSFWRVLSIITTIFGVTAATGLSVVGNFSEMDALTVHNIGAGVTFLSAIMYLCFTTGLSFLRPLLCSRTVAVVRVALTVLAIISLVFHECTLMLKIFVPAGTNETYNTGSAGYVPIFLATDSPFYVNHLVATSAEWLLAFAIFSYFITFVEEFRKASITLPSISLHVELLSPTYNNKRSEETRQTSTMTATSPSNDSHGI